MTKAAWECPHCHGPLRLADDRGVTVYTCCGHRESGERLVEEYENQGLLQLSMRREHWWGAA